MIAWKKRFPDSDDGCARSGDVLQQQTLESGVTMCSGGVKAWQAHLGKLPCLGKCWASLFRNASALPNLGLKKNNNHLF